MMNIRDILKKYTILAVLIVLIAILCILAPDRFMTASNFITIARQVSISAIIAVGMTFVLVGGNFDISSGSVLSFATVLSALLIVTYNVATPLALIITMIACTGIGFFNGFIVSRFAVPSLISTLAMQQIMQGVAYMLCGGLPIYGIPDGLKVVSQGNVFGFLPIPVIIMIVILIAGQLILSRTYLGRFMYAIGGNTKAAKLSGINVNAIRNTGFAIMGFLVSIAGIVMLGRVASGQPTVGMEYSLNTLAGVVLGGVSLSGGKGTIITGSFIGVLIFAVISNGLVILGFDEFIQLVIKGSVLLAAVVFDGYQSSRTGVKIAKKEKQEKQPA
ncbi:MAG: ABC transporter permease [Eubacteriales bacterium]|nr:ABC transporter permease [Eubacteriales bacterium]